VDIPAEIARREGKQQLHFDPAGKPRTAAMAAKLQSAPGKAAYRKRNVQFENCLIPKRAVA
jgi:hypothetical protein